MAAGTLYLCATPIGNLGDMTERCVEILRSVDLIAAEDTRNSIKLLNHFDIHTPMTAYHEFNRFEKAEELRDKILDGMNVACITDAGTPGISDPGEVLAKVCIDAGILVTSVPGPSACISALIISGLPTRRFRFEAFLPTEKKERAEILAEIKEDTATLVLYEAPHRLKKTLAELLDTLGDREISLCKELTKLHENVFRTTLRGAVEKYEKEEPKGEFVLVIRGKTAEEKAAEQAHEWSAMTIEEHVRFYEAAGETRKEAMKLVAKDRGVSKREIYQALLSEED